VPEFGSNRLRYVSKGREVGVTGPSNLRLGWPASTFFVVFFRRCGRSVLGAMARS
jgi:hypothetical protein